MIGMKEFPDKFFDLAIVDPPYGMDITNIWGKKEYGYKEWEVKDWDKNIPNKDYFNKLQGISKNQIIWGGNYYELKPTAGWIIWDKGQRNFALADGEMAWTSFDKAMRIFNYSRAKANSQIHIHPTQKPIALYKWLLKKYAKPTDKIIDTHAGSCSSVIAFLDFGCEWIAFEIDEDYYRDAMKRIENHKAQLCLNFPQSD